MMTEWRSRTTATAASRLRQWNLLMAALHLGQGLAMLSVANDFSLPVTSAFVRL